MQSTSTEPSLNYIEELIRIYTRVIICHFFIMQSMTPQQFSDSTINSILELGTPLLSSSQQDELTKINTPQEKILFIAESIE